jgi:hypothetical protein
MVMLVLLHVLLHVEVVAVVLVEEVVGVEEIKNV